MSLEKTPQSKREIEKVQPNAMSHAFKKFVVNRNKGKSEQRLGTLIGNEVFKTIKHVENTTRERVEKKVPIELVQIYGDDIPPKSITDLYWRLPPQKRQSYIQWLVAKGSKKAFRKPTGKKGSHIPHQEEKEGKSRTSQRIVLEDSQDLVDPWRVYGERRKTARDEFERMYPPGQPIPSDILERYQSLMDDQIKSFGSGNIDEQERITSEIEALVAEQKGKVKENLSSREVLKEPETTKEQENINDIRRKRIKKLRNDIAMFDSEIAHPTYPRTHDVIEREALAAEEELRNLESTLKAEEAHTYTVPIHEATGLIENFSTNSIGNEVFTIEGGSQESDLATRSTLGEEVLVANPDFALDSKYARNTQEHTPREWRDILRGLLEKLGANEHNRYLDEYFNNRLDELDVESKKMGVGENIFRSLGKGYAKLGFLQKLGIGFTLGVGAVAFTGVSFPVATACTFGLGVQRAFGMASMFLKFEEQLQEAAKGKSKGFITRREWYKALAEKTKDKQKETAMLMAVGYSLLMSVSIEETIQVINESSLSERVHEWLGHMLGHLTTTSEKSVSSPMTPVNISPSPEITVPTHQIDLKKWTEIHPSQPYPGDTTTGVEIEHFLAAQKNQPEMPTMPTIDASSGHGYEYMAKRLWEELHARGIKLPANASPHSDLARLLSANDEASLNKVVHQIASDSGHAFFHTDGTSVRIEPGTHMTIGTDGQIHLSIGKENFVHAPANVHVTPPFQTEVPTQTLSTEMKPHSENMIANSNIYQAPEVGLINKITPTEQVIHSPTVIEHVTQPVSNDSFVHDGTGGVVHDGEGNPVYEGGTHHQIPSHVRASVSEHGVFTNAHNIPVNLNETHGYSDKDGVLYVMGGNKDIIDTRAQDYALAHHVPVFVDKSYRLLDVINVPRVVEYIPTNNGSLEMVIHSGPSWVPNPKDFTKRIF